MVERPTIDVPVLIVGGGPIGLSASIVLQRLGVRSLLVERHPGTSLHPKARGITLRTMELFRQWGVEDAVRAHGVPPETRPFVTFARSLADPDYLHLRVEEDREALRRLSPTTGFGCSQDLLEPVLLARARELGHGEVRFDTELVSFEQDEDGVAATLHDRARDRRVRVRSRYLIGADGADSLVRRLLGSTMQGQCGLSHNLNVLCAADLGPLIADHPSRLYWVGNEHVTGVWATLNGADRWLLNVVWHPERGERLEDFTAERCAELVRHAAGVPDLAVEIVSTMPWTADALVADRWWQDRVFLAGDAAHLMPPYGGFGMNTGIQDIHNLGWKLAFVLAGWAGPGLLATYEAERRPTARFTIDEALRAMGARSESRPPTANEEERRRLASTNGLVLGYRYESAAVLPDGTPPPVVEDAVADYVPTARPGHRAPHLWLERQGATISTLDLFDTGFVLLAGPAGEAWCEAARGLAAAGAVPLAAYRVGPEGDLVDRAGDWPALYGVAPDGAVLIRPDGFVAWRCPSLAGAQPDELRGAVRAILEAAPAAAGRKR